MSATKLNATIRLSGSEIFTADEAPSAATAQQRTLNLGANTKLVKQLGASSTPAITKPPASLQLTLGSGVTTIDLTAIAGLATPGATRTLDMTGAKLVAAIISAGADNTNDVLVDGAVTTPYPLFGTGKSMLLKPGEVLAKCFNGVASTMPAVSGTVKNIGVSSGNAGDTVDIDLYFGT
jgi:hypothetical protein